MGIHVMGPLSHVCLLKCSNLKVSATLRIALTGGIGSGKSTVASIFEELGVPIIDSDVISRNIVKPNNACLDRIINEFGPEILTAEGSLDRDKLRNIIFNNDIAKTKLEEILHPVIYQEIDEQILAVDYPYCLIVVPLLIETQATDRFDRILLIDTDENKQVKRATNRDNTSSQLVEKIIKKQANRKQRLKYADDVIDNNVNIEKLRETVLELHYEYLELSN
jgi:dephospho-CoA kinase